DDRLAIDGRASSDSLRFGDVHLDAFAGQLRLDAPYADAPLSAADIEFNADSESAWLFGQQFAEVRLAANLDDSAGQLTLTSTRRNMSRALNLNARLLLLPDRNRFYVDDASLFAAGYTWTSAEATIIDVFADAVQTPGLTLDGYPSRAPTPERVQHLTLSGTLSERPADTLSAQITNVRLSEWAALKDLERPVRGIVDAQLAFTGGFNTPISVGTIRVDSLQYDRYDLGQLVVQSSYNAADAGRIRINAQLDQPAPTDSARTILDNEVRVAGTVRLPGLAEDRISDLDLTVEAERVDPFFFDYLFRAVSGTKGVLSGQVRMSGPFDNPAFEGAFALDGQFDLPAFGLQYAAEGNVDVQPDGLTLRDVQLSDGAGGTGEVDGRILFNDYRFFSFDLDGRLNELLVIDIEDAEDLLFYGRLAVSGTGTVTGPTFDALLRSSDAVTTPDSELFIPITVAEQLFDEAFITFADSTGAVPETPAPRENVLEQRPRTERSFVDGLSMNLNITAPPGSTVHLVFDPLLGDVVNAVGSGRVQFQKNRGEFATFGTFTVTSGDYLFTSQDIFARRFLLEPGGTLIWDGDPLDARLDLPASYRTRSSLAGLPVADPTQRVPLVVDMRLTNRVTAPLVDLSLRIDRDERSFIEVPAQLESLLNQSDRSAEFATSVLLTNSFLLTTNQAPDVQAAANQILFSSVSELVASQVNRFANAAFGLDLNFGVQQGRQEQLDLTYGFAVRLQDERLVIRGEGIYENNVNQTDDRLLGALVVEYQLSPSVSVEVFFRREDDFLETAASLDTSYGAGLVYQTEFVSWSEFRRRLFGGS
ncbi:MAG: translocation/assembly module TamB domain-containing protein, partial [Bacteroidota bacterium]